MIKLTKYKKLETASTSLKGLIVDKERV